MKNFGGTTQPGSGTTSDDVGGQDFLALVIACSASQPHRVGEIAFLPLGQWLYIGRGDPELEKFAHFVRQQSGKVAAVDPEEGVLEGKTISKRQLRVRFVGDGIEVESIGLCRMYINGKECKKGVLRPGDTLRLKGEVVLLCVSRSRELPKLLSGPARHAFGEADADGIVGESEGAYRMRAQLENAAHGDHHVFVEGETGTGKELAAAAVHRRSSRAKGPYVSYNASVFTETLIASELFGNPAGYPNPGMPARKGLIGTAHRGTLFFDEIGDCPRVVQAQLLRFMEVGEYQLQGEAVVTRADVRFIGATHRDPSDPSVFREDFVARFKKRVELLPLRERREDLALIARHLMVLFAQGDEEPNKEFRKRFCRETVDGRPEPRFSGRLIDELLHHPLPDNVRGLERLLHEAITYSSAGEGDELRPPKGGFKVDAAKVRATPQGRSAAPRGKPGQEELLALLKQERWNVTRVAEILGMQRSALHRLMKSYGLEREGRGSGE